MPGVVIPMPRAQFFDDDGDPVSSGKLYSYAAGTSSLLDTFSDAALSTPNTNPIILDAAGRASIYLTAATSYKFVLASASGATIWTQDGITVAAAVAIVTQIVAGAHISLSYTGSTSGTGAVTVGVDATLAAVYTGGIALAGQAANDIMYASSATQWARLAKGTAGQGLRVNAGATALEWSELNYPITDDGAALGNATTLRWSDLFLASGAVINWLNGAVTLTHSSNKLALAGGALEVSYLGTHAITGGGNSVQQLKVENTANTAAASARVSVYAEAEYFLIDKYCAAFTTSGTEIASSSRIYESGAGGLSLVAAHASGDIRFYAGGTTLRWTITDAGLLTGDANISISRGATAASLMLAGNSTTTTLASAATGVKLMNSGTGASPYLEFATGAWTLYAEDGVGGSGSLSMSSAGAVTVSSLAGVGTRNVVVSATGVLSAP